MNDGLQETGGTDKWMNKRRNFFCRKMCCKDDERNYSGSQRCGLT